MKFRKGDEILIKSRICGVYKGKVIACKSNGHIEYETFDAIKNKYRPDFISVARPEIIVGHLDDEGRAWVEQMVAIEAEHSKNIQRIHAAYRRKEAAWRKKVTAHYF